MDWRITIIKADNGYILEAPRVENKDENGNDIIMVDREVIEEKYDGIDTNLYETNDEGKITLARMLEHVAEYFGQNYEKFNKNNLNIKFNLKGSKIYDEEEED